MKTIRFRAIKPVFYTAEFCCEDNVKYRVGTRFTSPGQIADYMKALQDDSKESFIVFHLDGKNRISCLEVVSVGSLNQSIVHPREVFKTALLVSAAAVILVHNHPSGDPEPSNEDKAITRRLKEAGDVLGVQVLDHIIVGYDGYYSFTERGVL